ncbi:alpha/beta hydrolase [Tissierella carlieri]|uniref:alpha/beta fold hydrolase n=1 Tax=Tissierella carlieri TaxID=689904 RepID=UPI001C10B1EA|nr:alpha/beta hydrolase [Tissierella carlieri]MBU5311596.1 alpha/beta hydrolase [Tissierella carlieri]
MKNKKAFKTKQGRDELIKYSDMLLEELTIPYERLNINTRHGNTFCITAGDISAPPMILLHGSSMNSCMWVSDILKYHPKYRVYALDIPGEPGRSDERQLPFTTSDLDDWLYDVFNELSLNKAVVIGASLGAWLATKFAIRYPEKIDKLVLLCPAGIGTQNKSFIFTALFHMAFGEKGIRKLFKIINGNVDMPEIMLKFQILIGKNFNTRKEPIPIFRDDEIRRLTMPVFLFVGEKDIILHSMETADRLKKLVPNVRINILPEGGHSLINLTDTILEQIK